MQGIPVEIADLMAEHGQSWADLLDERGMGDSMDWYDAARYLDEHLPADVAEHYGLDIH